MDSKASPILIRYARILEGDKRSRVFAPLAEGHRKLGLVDKAIHICKEGIKHNPSYILGHQVLAHCYFDLGQKLMAYETLRPFVTTNRDNISLQKLYAQIAEEIGEFSEALETYKFLLFMNPKDPDVAKKVADLENRSVITKELVKNSNTSFAVDLLSSQSDIDQWVPVEFGLQNVSIEPIKENQRSQEEVQQKSIEPVDTLDQWNEFKLPNNEVIPSVDVEAPVVNNVEEREFQLKTEVITPNPMRQDISIEKKPQEEQPLVTHTLIDLYLKQGLRSKAIESLEKMIELNPSDSKGLEKLQMLKSQQKDEGHQELLGLYDQVVSKKENHFQVTAQKLEEFLKRIVLRAQIKRQAFET